MMFLYSKRFPMLGHIQSAVPPSIWICQYFYWNLTINTDKYWKLGEFSTYIIHGALCKMLKNTENICKILKNGNIYIYWKVGEQLGGTESGNNYLYHRWCQSAWRLREHTQSAGIQDQTLMRCKDHLDRFDTILFGEILISKLLLRSFSLATS